MTNTPQIKSEQLTDVLQEILDGQKQIQKQLTDVNKKVNDLEVEVKAWGSWLRNVLGAVLFVVSISFISLPKEDPRLCR